MMRVIENGYQVAIVSEEWFVPGFAEHAYDQSGIQFGIERGGDSYFVRYYTYFDNHLYRSIFHPDHEFSPWRFHTEEAAILEEFNRGTIPYYYDELTFTVTVEKYTFLLSKLPKDWPWAWVIPKPKGFGSKP